jgi:hypothetical protein
MGWAIVLAVVVSVTLLALWLAHLLDEDMD